MHLSLLITQLAIHNSSNIKNPALRLASRLQSLIRSCNNSFLAQKREGKDYKHERTHYIFYTISFVTFQERSIFKIIKLKISLRKQILVNNFRFQSVKSTWFEKEKKQMTELVQISLLNIMVSLNARGHIGSKQ